MYIKNLTKEQAKQIIKWRYETPYDFYNMDDDKDSLNELLHYYGVFDGKDLIGFYCLESFAQVPIGREKGLYPEMEGLIDLGFGLKPELTGQGYGYRFINFIIDEIQQKYNLNKIRLTVAEFNKRAISLYEKLGFEMKSSFTANNTAFLVMIKKL
ncbi:GNAT family N-acetyltransferase [Lederbergia wuyishanensis]|uniref:RimJ/RimL family protein N-acetyltransferase n=1 Tax=Lederbergia wuyishanensis TaxID=1347903 RepID=A0ABU0D0G5_9BACI|nr:GNAT family N-acetyltransferase [Lederbergia wuyishanensis]MCJ8006525.1 GNAT family N-acetyltransferase [Lederbergia wuyishanensis]MDQ0341902.1 RimJ/RimL family protein N-acetyltransferase [Lederbergia wuyishanensis]